MIQQIIKNDKTPKTKESEKVENSKDEEVTYQDEYSGAIKFLQSPITDNFLSDLREQLQIEFDKSFRTIKDYEGLEKDIKKTTKNGSEKNLNEETLSNLKTAVLERLSTIFLPEFLNRLDDIIIFQPLKPEELRKICDIMVKDVTERVKLKQITLIVDEKVKLKLTREGYNPIFGARPLRRLITKYIEDLISENILKNPLKTRLRTIRIQLNENDQIIVQNEENEL